MVPRSVASRLRTTLARTLFHDDDEPDHVHDYEGFDLPPSSSGDGNNKEKEKTVIYETWKQQPNNDDDEITVIRAPNPQQEPTSSVVES
ncbi:hypothetical protein LSH36_54g03032 [Paralvinella palmiformis]|uniref:Uncharacterized protein n=1 Tax=Paralvinella palmiformis TaxID=53620 RepID=A0AAD9K5J1_9ANNE|nr:hypothetical protein LSH36_54g03032 [Paralvinella palmiformis]